MVEIIDRGKHNIWDFWSSGSHQGLEKEREKCTYLMDSFPLKHVSLPMG